MAMARPEPSKGAAGRAPKTIANSWRAHIPSTCGSTTAPSLLPYRWNEAVEQSTVPGRRVSSTRTPCLLGLVSPSSVAVVAVWRGLARLARDYRRTGEDRRGPEASNEEPNTERELPDGLGRCECDGKSRGCVPGPQQHTDTREKGQRTTDEADHHQRPRKQSGSPHQVAQKNPVAEPGAELRAEKGGLIMYGKQSTGDVNKSPAVVCGVGEILAQGHDRHQAHDADQNENRLHRARGDVPEGDAFADPLHDGENDHGGGDASDGQQDLKQGTNGYEDVLAAADNVVGVVQDRVVEKEGRDRDECAKEPGTHDPRGSLLSRGGREQTLTGWIGDSASGALRSRFVPLCTHPEPPSLDETCGVN